MGVESKLLHTIFMFIKRKVFELSLCLIFLLIFTVRFFYVKTGLPYIHNWDEPQTASTALSIIKSGNFNPEFFNYGSLAIYLNAIVDVFHYLYLMGQNSSVTPHLTSINDIVINSDTGWHWTISHPSFFKWNRVLTVFFGLGVNFITYLLAKTLFNKYVGLLSVLFLGFVQYHVIQSAWITTDMPACFFTLAAVYHSVLYYQKCNKQNLLYASLFIGMACATKYNSAIVLLIPLLFILANSYKDKVFEYRLLAYVIGIGFLTFLVCMPYALLDLSGFLQGIGDELRHYTVLGHGSASIEPGWTHFVYQSKIIFTYFGAVPSSLFLIGLLSLFKTKTSTQFMLLLFPVIFVLYMVQMRVNFQRNFLHVYPFISIVAACGTFQVYRRVSSYGRWPKNIAILLISVFFLANVSTSLRIALNNYKSVETRTYAIDYLVDKLEGKRGVVLAKELRIHKDDYSKLAVDVRFESISQILSELKLNEGSDLIYVIPSELMVLKKRPKKSDLRNAQIRDHEVLLNRIVSSVIKEVPGKATRLNKPSVNPGVIIFSN